MAYFFTVGAVPGSWFGGPYEGFEPIEGDFGIVRGQHGKPTSVQWNGPKRPIPDILNMPYLCISIRLKNLIESFEPEIHDFSPVDLIWDDGTLAEKRFFLHVKQRVYSLSFEFSHAPENSVTGGLSMLNKQTVFHAMRFGNRHLWQDEQLQHGNKEFVVSDELANRIHDDGYTGVYLKYAPQTDKHGNFERPAPSKNRVLELMYDDLRPRPAREWAMDGDWDLVEPTVHVPGFEARRGSYGFRAIDLGVPIETSHVPTKVHYGARRKLPTDLSWAEGFWTISERFRVLIESIEPDVHQFIPVKYFKKKFTFLEDRYILVVCQSIDGIDPDATGYSRDNGMWYNPGGEIGHKVFSKSKIGGAHLWRDRFVDLTGIFLSYKLAEAIENSQMTGISFGSYKIV